MKQKCRGRKRAEVKHWSQLSTTEPTGSDGRPCRACRRAAIQRVQRDATRGRARLTWAAPNIHSISFPGLSLVVIVLFTSIACLSPGVLLWTSTRKPQWLVANSNVTKDPPDHCSSFVCATRRCFLHALSSQPPWTQYRSPTPLCLRQHPTC